MDRYITSGQANGRYVPATLLTRRTGFTKSHLRIVRFGRTISAAGAAVILAIALLGVGVGTGTANGRDVTASPAQTGSGWEPGPERYGVEVEHDVPVRMSDGVTLTATVLRPTDLQTGQRAEESFPVILNQNPYSFAGSPDVVDTYESKYFVRRGYIYVLTHTRGTMTSGGEFCLVCDREKLDGAELVDWAAHKLIGSDGRIALTGRSYSALSALWTAAYVGPNSPVKAVVSNAMGWSSYRLPFFHGGAMTPTADVYFGGEGAFKGSPSAEAFGAGLLADMKAGKDPAYDKEFWPARMAANAVKRIVRNDLPVLIETGWQDNYSITATELYSMFQNVARDRDQWAPMTRNQVTTPRYQLVVNEHGGHGGKPVDDRVRELRWFDTWVKGIGTGVSDTKETARFWELNSNRWVTSSTYPMTDDYQSYYLQSNGLLTQEEPTKFAGSDQFIYALPDSGAELSYVTAPFPDGATVAGPLSLTLYAASSNKNIQVIADVYDVATDGTAVRLTNGALTGSMRELDGEKTWHDRTGRIIRPHHAFTQNRDVVPGTVTRLDISLLPRLAAIAPGHHLRLDLKSQNSVADRTECRSHTYSCVDPIPEQQATLLGGRYDIQHNGLWPSHLNLPIRPYLDEFGAQGGRQSPVGTTARGRSGGGGVG